MRKNLNYPTGPGTVLRNPGFTVHRQVSADLCGERCAPLLSTGIKRFAGLDDTY